MRSYLELLAKVLERGCPRSDRTGVGTRSLFGQTFESDLSEGYPLLTTKKVSFRSIIEELLWFVAGRTDVRWLNGRKVTIWDEWADANGDLGPIYGYQWRRWPGRDGQATDQLQNAFNLLSEDPRSRRIVVNSWNVAELDRMALPPCHLCFQLQVEEDRLNCLVHQRSADIFLGVPFNIASYAALVGMFCQLLPLVPGRLLFAFGDLHLYNNHLDQARLQLERSPGTQPRLEFIEAPKDLFSFRFEHFRLTGYSPQPAIAAPIAV